MSVSVCAGMFVSLSVCVPVLFVRREAPAVCWSLTDCNAPVIPLLAGSTVPAIKFPSQRSLTNYFQQMPRLSNANNTTICSNSAGSHNMAW